jgi:hypothetical protein
VAAAICAFDLPNGNQEKYLHERMKVFADKQVCLPFICTWNRIKKEYSNNIG